VQLKQVKFPAFMEGIYSGGEDRFINVHFIKDDRARSVIKKSEVVQSARLKVRVGERCELFY
jgi:hypothetical protein